MCHVRPPLYVHLTTWRIWPDSKLARPMSILLPSLQNVVLGQQARRYIGGPITWALVMQTQEISVWTTLLSHLSIRYGFKYGVDHTLIPVTQVCIYIIR